jgi:hypothetical protein
LVPESRTGKPDVNQIGANLIDAVTGDLPKEEPESDKNPAAVPLGRLGGLKSGKARTANILPLARHARRMGEVAK